MERAELLAAFTEEPGRLTRRFGTQAHAEAGAAVSDWMGAAGMAVRRDAVGNLIGRYEAGDGDAPALLLGSHLDTVPDAGRYDGALGVLAGIAAVERLVTAGSAPPVRARGGRVRGRGGGALWHRVSRQLGAGGQLRRGEPAASRRRRGFAGGGHPRFRRRSRRGSPGPREQPGSLVGYAEVHIEQGPVLEERGLALGVVSGIAGQTRAALCFEGVTGHAGTVPMELRRDALCAAAELVRGGRGGRPRDSRPRRDRR